MHQWNEGWKRGEKIAGFDIDSQSGTQEPQPRHSCCSVVNLALYSPGTLQGHRNNRKEIEETMGLIYLSRSRMIIKISIHDAFCWGKQSLLERKLISKMWPFLYIPVQTMHWMSWCWIWKIITCQVERSQAVPPPTSNTKKGKHWQTHCWAFCSTSAILNLQLSLLC